MGKHLTTEIHYSNRSENIVVKRNLIIEREKEREREREIPFLKNIEISTAFTQIKITPMKFTFNSQRFVVYFTRSSLSSGSRSKEGTKKVSTE